MEPQLGWNTFYVSWDQFEEKIHKKYIFEEYLERKLNEFHDLKQGTNIVLEYETRFMDFLRYAPHINA